ncbi:MAG: lipocalin family protein [Proteobacteria bacterium]|nr:lipocalin family protein [Pseudomonadota bacterium]
MKYNKTVEHVDVEKFMGRWYVQAGRFTFLEKGAHNAVETYAYNKADEKILIDFTFNKDSFDGKKKSIPQKGKIHNKQTGAHWKVSPFWPLEFDYLIIDLADDYSWTAIGVPNQKYLWIMSRDWNFSDQKVQEVLNRLKDKGYDAENTVRVLHRW